MRPTKLYIPFLIMLLIGSSFVMIQAQPARRENIKQLKIAFFTNKLNLTVEEAQVFWPVYNAYSNELDALRKKRKNLQRELRDKMDSSNDKELEKILDQFASSRGEEIMITDTYYLKFKKMLPIRKVIKLLRAEEQFKQRLIEVLREKRGRN